ncbi:hypothetical protein [Ancylobacter terrae]|uniref:hypothetical protein n=1 Tax=Ancylobacter sp. sgz301288 TaxID=3342077 RepID=UPI0038589FFD
MTGLARLLAGAVLVAAAVPAVASADPLGDYIAARDKATAASIDAAKADKSGDEAVIKREEADMKDLAKRLGAVLGPLKFKGLGAPTYTLYSFIYDVSGPTHQLDGLNFTNKDFTSRIVVTPAAVFENWRAARAKDEGAPAALGAGVAEAAATAEFYTDAIGFDGGFFQPYVTIPVAAVPGETAVAVLGLQIDEPPGNAAPDDIAIVRVADGKAMVGLTQAKLNIKGVPVCDAVWKPYQVKVEALTKVVEAENKPEDPRWDEIVKITDEGSDAYRACFVKEAPKQPFFANAVKRAEAFLQTARGK